MFIRSTNSSKNLMAAASISRCVLPELDASQGCDGETTCGRDSVSVDSQDSLRALKLVLTAILRGGCGLPERPLDGYKAPVAAVGSLFRDPRQHCVVDALKLVLAQAFTECPSADALRLVLAQAFTKCPSADALKLVLAHAFTECPSAL